MMLDFINRYTACNIASLMPPHSIRNNSQKIMAAIKAINSKTVLIDRSATPRV